MASYKNTGLCVRNTFLSAETSSTSWCRSESSPPGGAIGNAGRKDRPALPVKSDEASALNNPSEPTVTTLMIGRLPPGTTSRSLAETVCGALAKVLCDFAFVAQDRTNSGELRNFRFGFLNFKDPAVAVPGSPPAPSSLTMASCQYTGMFVRNTFLTAETSSTSWCRSESAPPGGAIRDAGIKVRRHVIKPAVQEPASLVTAGEDCAFSTPDGPTVTTLRIGRLPPGTTSRSLAETVCGALAPVLCDFAFVAQDRTDNGDLRNFKFGFLNFKDPAVAASILENGIPDSGLTMCCSREQGLDDNVRCYWGGVERRGCTGELTEEFRPLVMGTMGWEAVEMPENVQ
eukprot:CAMPEP_0204450424 /NCGR_PEP_ID=MMETSP0470-20130426/100340_1 /ASSEMBLY_ACC=CAM_ASM_000385 /TAXON_ID=2969 /ORGANISM="Oxyrrhis marina" /LENGTH=343 /DNA_ID=CAMNT_0051450259 /DNA_START=45 /DNA_END=1073 /DNA_ORIENTATION=-